MRPFSVGLSGKCKGIPSAVLALAVVLVLVLVAIQSAQAQTLTVLYNFAGSSDGGDPYASLIRDADGNLYSTVGYGGGASYSGGVFKVDAKGNETMLYSFTGGTDGAFPISALVRDHEGNLYGTTTQGGSAGAGVVFKVDPSGNETVLHNFTGGSDGAGPGWRVAPGQSRESLRHHITRRHFQLWSAVQVKSAGKRNDFAYFYWSGERREISDLHQPADG